MPPKLWSWRRYDGVEPVNLGSGQEISIRDLVQLVARSCGYNHQIVWDTSKPNGQPRSLDISRAEHYFGFRAKCSLAEGSRYDDRLVLSGVHSDPSLE